MGKTRWVRPYFLMDPTTKWLVRITCLVFLGGVIAIPLYLKQQKIENFCLKTAKELSLENELAKKMRKDCRKSPKAYGY